jgi:hypothetical protein
VGEKGESARKARRLAIFFASPAAFIASWRINLGATAEVLGTE